jgi:hypothetical protein
LFLQEQKKDMIIITSFTGVVMAQLTGTDGTDWPRRFDHAVWFLIILTTASLNSG